MSSRPIHVVKMANVIFFLWLNKFHDTYIHCTFIHPSTYGQLNCSIPWLPWIVLEWTWGCIHLFELVFPSSSDKYPEVKLLDHVVILFLIIWGLCRNIVLLFLNLWENSMLFYSSCTILHFYWQCPEVLVSLHPCQLLLFLFVCL